MSKSIRFISHEQFIGSVPGMVFTLRKLEFPTKNKKVAAKAVNNIDILMVTLKIMRRFYVDLAGKKAIKKELGC